MTKASGREFQAMNSLLSRGGGGQTLPGIEGGGGLEDCLGHLHALRLRRPRWIYGNIGSWGTEPFGAGRALRLTSVRGDPDSWRLSSLTPGCQCDA